MVGVDTEHIALPGPAQRRLDVANAIDAVGCHPRGDYRKFRVLGGLEGKKEPYYVTTQSPIDIQ